MAFKSTNSPNQEVYQALWKELNDVDAKLLEMNNAYQERMRKLEEEKIAAEEELAEARKVQQEKEEADLKQKEKDEKILMEKRDEEQNYWTQSEWTQAQECEKEVEEMEAYFKEKEEKRQEELSEFIANTKKAEENFNAAFEKLIEEGEKEKDLETKSEQFQFKKKELLQKMATGIDYASISTPTKRKYNEHEDWMQKLEKSHEDEKRSALLELEGQRKLLTDCQSKLSDASWKAREFKQELSLKHSKELMTERKHLQQLEATETELKSKLKWFKLSKSKPKQPELEEAKTKVLEHKAAMELNAKRRETEINDAQKDLGNLYFFLNFIIFI